MRRNKRKAPAAFTTSDGWHDISTAPRDGTWFLICRDDEGFDSYEIGCYEPLMHDRFEPAEGGLYRKVPVKILDHRGFNNFHRATHWMPLPAPPRPGDRTDSGEAQDGSLNQTSINAVPKPEGE